MIIDLVIGIAKAIHTFRIGKINPSTFNDELKDMYNWSNVAERTEKVYSAISQSQTSPLIERLRRYYGCGIYAGKIFCMMMALDYLIWKFLEWVFPEETIEKAEVFPYKKYREYFEYQETDDITVIKRSKLSYDIIQEEEEG